MVVVAPHPHDLVTLDLDEDAADRRADPAEALDRSALGGLAFDHGHAADSLMEPGHLAPVGHA